MMSLDEGFRRLGQDIEKRNTVERAIELVMLKGGLSHTEALRRIRQLQVTTRKPLVEVARGLLDAGGSTS